MLDDWPHDYRSGSEIMTTRRCHAWRRIRMWADCLILCGLFGAVMGIALASSPSPGQLSFSSDGRTLVGSVNGYDWPEPDDLLSYYGVIKSWDVACGKAPNWLTGPPKWIRSFALSPDGSTIAVADDSPSVELWDPGQGIRKGTFNGQRANIREVLFSPVGMTLASSNHDGEVPIRGSGTADQRHQGSLAQIESRFLGFLNLSAVRES